MKIIFLDFDGVLNSQQCWYYKRNRKRKSLYWRWREELGKKLYLRFKRGKDGMYSSSSVRKDPLGILQAIQDFSRKYIIDYSEFCPIACSNVQYILDKDPEVMIVVSSVWRHDGVKRLREIFKRNKIDPERLIDVTPYGHEDAQGNTLDIVKDKDRDKESGYRLIGRGTQIQKWLNHWEGEPITHFVIIDDDSDMCHLMDKLVKTDGDMGFMFDKVKEVLRRLQT